MLTLTPQATDAIKQLIEGSETPEGGLRIFAQPVNETEATLELQLVEAPDPSDQVLQNEGANVFLEPNASAFLDDKVLNAEMEGETIRFAIEETGPSNPDNGQVQV